MLLHLADNPVTLIEQGAPHRIHNDKELERYTASLFRLTAKDRPTLAERETIDLLTLLIEEYEGQYRLPKADAIDTLKYLMEKQSLRHQDLSPELGSSANISLILSRQRQLTLRHIKALSMRFNLPMVSFLPSMEQKEGKRRVRAGSKTVTL